ncbi:MAG: hypothetical protein IIW90_08760, partial [Alistipes sp.]|nr:hypothetical protein [Alistipes sp.]
ALAGRELRRKFPLRNGDFLIASKMPKASVLGNLLLCADNDSPSVFLRYFLTLKSSRNECLKAR